MIHVGADARLWALDLILGRISFGGLVLKLFTNDVLPEDAELVEDYTELEAHGYSDSALDPEQWVTAPGDMVNARAEPALAVYPKVTWTFKAGPPVPVYGYFVTTDDEGRLAWSERFAREQIVEFDGDNISVVPTFRLRAMAAMPPAIQDGVGA